MQLDWAAAARDPSGVREALAAPFDVVFGTDIVYQREDIELIVEVLRALLAPGGGCMSLFPHSRWVVASPQVSRAPY